MIEHGVSDLVLLVDTLSRLTDPVTLAEIILEGIGKGAVYFIIAVGLTLIFGLMGVLNFAHGAMAMLGAYLAAVLMLFAVSGGMGFLTVMAIFFVVAAVVLALVTALGAALEVKLIRPVYDRPPMYQILITFGIALVAEELMRIILNWYDIRPAVRWDRPRGTMPDVLAGSVDLFGASIRGLYLFEMFLGAVLIVLVYLFLTRTLYGLYIRAGSEDEEMAQALGIDVRRTFTIVFGIGTGLAALGGVLLMWDPLWGPTVHLNIDVLLYAFVVVIIGGLGSFKGTVAAAFIVGIADSFATWIFHVGIIEFAGLPEMTIFLLLVIMLIIRPRGLYGLEEVGGH